MSLLPLSDEMHIVDFKPVVYEHLGMDMLVAMTEDCSYRSEWIDHIHLEPYLHPYKNKMVGFSLVSSKGLLKKGETDSVLRLIMRAMISDWKNRKKWTRITKRKLLKIYARAFFLIIRRPTMWKFHKSVA